MKLRRVAPSDVECLYKGAAFQVRYERIVRLSLKAVLIQFKDREHWIPNSQIAYVDDTTIWLSRWIIEDRRIGDPGDSPNEVEDWG